MANLPQVAGEPRPRLHAWVGAALDNIDTGLQAVRERLAALGGKVALKGLRSHGTSVSVSIPLAAPDMATAAALSDKITT